LDAGSGIVLTDYGEIDVEASAEKGPSRQLAFVVHLICALSGCVLCPKFENAMLERSDEEEVQKMSAWGAGRKGAKEGVG
jgi:hypothetical protein